MLSIVAVLPQPPLLVPELAAGATADGAALRDGCLSAARRLASTASSWVVVGADADGRRSVPPSAAGTFAGFGADVRVALAPERLGPEQPERVGREPDPCLPLPLLVAGWLRGQAGPAAWVRGELVPPDLGPPDCAALGAELAGELAGTAEAAALLAVGDGAATHTEKAPGYLDPRAGPFDDAVAGALADADPSALLALDPDLAAELQAIGRAPWQVLAGAVQHSGGRWRGDMIYSGAPWGVGYHVAVWTRP